MIGKFIVFEGLDIEILTDQAERLASWYKIETDIKSVVLTREPSEGLLGTQLRFLYKNSTIHQYALAAAENTDRYYHVSRNDGILARLAQGSCVISVRYVLHSLLNQSELVSLDWLMQINQICAWPDITFFVDTPVPSILTKLVSEQGFDSEEIEKQQFALEKKRKMYLETINVLSKQGKLVDILDGDSATTIHNRCVERIERNTKE